MPSDSSTSTSVKPPFLAEAEIPQGNLPLSWPNWECGEFMSQSLLGTFTEHYRLRVRKQVISPAGLRTASRKVWRALLRQRRLSRSGIWGGGGPKILRRPAFLSHGLGPGCAVSVWWTGMSPSWENLPPRSRAILRGELLVIYLAETIVAAQGRKFVFRRGTGAIDTNVRVKIALQNGRTSVFAGDNRGFAAELRV
jgi:hypothetical protein